MGIHKSLLSRIELIQVKSAPRKKRDQLILGVLIETGCSVSELCNLRVKDFSVEKETISFPFQKRSRIIAVPQYLAIALAEHVAGQKPGEYVFSSRKSGRVTTKRVRQIVHEATQKAFGRPLDPIVFLYSRFALLLEKGHKSRDVAKHLGLSASRGEQLAKDIAKSLQPESAPSRIVALEPKLIPRAPRKSLLEDAAEKLVDAYADAKLKFKETFPRAKAAVPKPKPRPPPVTPIRHDVAPRSRSKSYTIPLSILFVLLVAGGLLWFATLPALTPKGPGTSSITSAFFLGEGSELGSQPIGLEFSGGGISEIQLDIDGAFTLTSLKATGSWVGSGNFVVYAEDALTGKRYLLLTNTVLSRQPPGLELTGNIVAGNSSSTAPSNESNITNATNTINTANATNATTATVDLVNQSNVTQSNATKTTNASNATQPAPANDSIIIALRYNQNSSFDPNNDGRESTSGVIDFSVADTALPAGLDTSKLCTVWRVEPVGSANSTQVCHGASACCAPAGLEPRTADWGAPFEVYHGLYGAGADNLVSAKVAYVDSGQGGAETFLFSNWSSLPAQFIADLIDFSSACAETCTLPPGFNSRTLRLVVEVTDGMLSLDTLEYTFVPGESVPTQLQYTLLKQDVFDVIVDETRIEGADLHVTLHHTSARQEPVRVFTGASYAVLNTMPGLFEPFTIIIHEYVDQYFEVKVGEESVVLAFGTPRQLKVKFDLVDAEGNPLNASLEARNSLSRTLELVGKSAGERLDLKEGLHDLDVELVSGPVKKITFHGVKVDRNWTDAIGLDDTPELPEFGDSLEVFAIDPTALEFDYAEVTFIAVGNILTKCKAWNFTSRTCTDGVWITVLDGLELGKEYTFNLTPEDPAYSQSGGQTLVCVNDGSTVTCSDTGITTSALSTSDCSGAACPFINLGSGGDSYLEVRFGTLGISDSETLVAANVTFEYMDEKTTFDSQELRCYNGSTWIQIASPTITLTETTTTFNISVPDCYKPVSRANDVRVRFGQFSPWADSGELYFDFVQLQVETSTDAPGWSNLVDNETATAPRKNDRIQINVTLSDDFNLSSYTFSWNDSGTFVNDSPVSISGTNVTISLNKTVTANKSQVIGYLFYFNDSENQQNQTDIGNFTVKSTLPSAPVLLQPENNSTTTNRTPEFTWNNSNDLDGDALTYNLVVDDNANFSSPVINQTAITETANSTSYDSTTKLDVDTTYFWRVRAHDGTGYGSFSSVSNFTVESAVSLVCVNDGSTVTCSDTGITTSALLTSDCSGAACPFINLGSGGDSYLEVRFGTLGISDSETLVAANVTFEYMDEKTTFDSQELRCYNGSTWIQIASPTITLTETTTTFNISVPDCYKPVSRANDVRVRFGQFSPYADSGELYFDFVQLQVETSTGGGAPGWSNLVDNETATAPRKNDPIQINVTLSDDIGLSSYTFSWNDSGTFVNDSTVSISGTNVTISLNRTVTANKSQVVGYLFYFNDSANQQNQTDIGNFTVKNTLPSAPVLLQPENNATITNRTPRFTWNNSNDADNDTLTYHLQVDDNADFSSPVINQTAITETANSTSYDSTTELDVDILYYWKVRAHDGTGYGSSSNTRNFTVESFAALSLVTGTINFGDLGLFATDNTTDDSPPPFLLENQGNVYVNITVTGSRLFTQGSFPSNNFRFKIDENEGSSFNFALSTTIFTDITNSSSTIDILDLDWHDASDTAETDLLVLVPGDEPSGTKNASVTFSMT